MKKYVKCSQCYSDNTELEIDESLNDGNEETIYISVWCINCMTYSPFSIDEDWREYV